MLKQKIKQLAYFPSTNFKLYKMFLFFSLGILFLDHPSPKSLPSVIFYRLTSSKGCTWSFLDITETGNSSWSFKAATLPTLPPSKPHLSKFCYTRSLQTLHLVCAPLRLMPADGSHKPLPRLAWSAEQLRFALVLNTVISFSIFCSLRILSFKKRQNNFMSWHVEEERWKTSVPPICKHFWKRIKAGAHR